MFTQVCQSHCVTDCFSSLHGPSFFVRQGPAAKSLNSWEKERGKKQKNEHVFLTNCWLKTLLCSRLLPGEVHPPFCQPFGCWFCPAFSKRNIETIWNQAWPGASYGLSECETLDSDPDLPRSNLIIWHLQKKNAAPSETCQGMFYSLPTRWLVSPRPTSSQLETDQVWRNPWDPNRTSGERLELCLVICPGDWVASCKPNSMHLSWNVMIGWFMWWL